jgi:hypothetical protein
MPRAAEKPRGSKPQAKKSPKKTASASKEQTRVTVYVRGKNQPLRITRPGHLVADAVGASTDSSGGKPVDEVRIHAGKPVKHPH